MTIVAATKYVPLAEMAVLVEAGIEVVGENRAQDLEEKHAVYGDAFHWHFIGHLQSNKVKVVNRALRARPFARLPLRGSASSRIPALLQVNLAGEDSKGGIALGRRDRGVQRL